MSKIKVIGLAGNRGVGKDTFYSCLTECRPSLFKRYAFADALKLDLDPFLQSKFNINVFNCTPEQKEIIRPILIAYGCAQRAVDVDYWAKRVCKKIETDNKLSSIRYVSVVTDVRFENEVEILKKTFGNEFVLVDIAREGAPPPTDEEEKHFRQVAAMAEYHMMWRNDEKSLQLEFAEIFLKSYFPR